VKRGGRNVVVGGGWWWLVVVVVVVGGGGGQEYHRHTQRHKPHQPTLSLQSVLFYLLQSCEGGCVLLSWPVPPRQPLLGPVPPSATPCSFKRVTAPRRRVFQSEAAVHPLNTCVVVVQARSVTMTKATADNGVMIKVVASLTFCQLCFSGYAVLSKVRAASVVNPPCTSLSSCLLQGESSGVGQCNPPSPCTPLRCLLQAESSS
jgi:hypothetical protein